MLVLIQFFLSVQVNQDRVYKELDLEMNRIFLTNHLEGTLQYNFALDQENSTLGNNCTPVFINNQESLTYKISEGGLILEKDLESINLTNRKARVQSMSCTTIVDAQNNISAIKIDLQLTHRDNNRIIHNFGTLIKLTNYGN